MVERCECCGEGKDPMNETETAWQCNDCEQWNGEEPHEPHCPAVDGFGCRCGEGENQ
jgi:hypothetical protein